MFGKKAKRIKELEDENKSLKKQAASFDLLTRQLANAFEKTDPAACLKEANNAYANFLQFHANEAEKGRAHGDRVYEDLRKRLDDARDRVEALYQFMIVAGHRIGVFEGLLRNRSNASISRGDLQPLVESWSAYQQKLIRG